MYFWRIARLREDLVASRVGERESLGYVLWFGGVTTLLSSLPLGEFNLWDYVDVVTMFAAFLIGTAYVFRCNGGSSGREFLTRYVSLNWVFGIRFFFLVAIPVFAAVLVIQSYLPGGLPLETTPWESGTLAALEGVFYFGLGQHFKKVAAA